MGKGTDDQMIKLDAASLRQLLSKVAAAPSLRAHAKTYVEKPVCTRTGSTDKNIQLHRSVLNELGYDLDSRFTILDFGCGDGKRVCQYRAAGFNAFGVDIKLDTRNDFLRLIPTDKQYRIPFDDRTFDFVYSEQVLEHVQDYPAALSEVARVLKPDGFSLHIFPSKYRLLEPHVFVPLGGIIREYPWLLFWAWLGIRNSFQKGLKYKDAADLNYDYLKTATCYLSAKKIRSKRLLDLDF